jgi:catechol-2,3-dioxygenase
MTPLFIDHLVFIVKDLSHTEKFYTTFLGEPTYFEKETLIYQVSDTKLFFVLPKIAWEPVDKDKSGLNHLAFGVRNIDDLKEFAATLDNGGIKNSGVKIDTHGGKDYIWFDDPNGMRLEFYCRPNG